MRAHDHHRKLRAAHRLHHVQVAIAVAGIESPERDRNQKIAACSTAVAFTFGVVTRAVDFMHRMRDVPGKRGLNEKPIDSEHCFALERQRQPR